jgi:MoxR-like ATPase
METLDKNQMFDDGVIVPEDFEEGGYIATRYIQDFDLIVYENLLEEFKELLSAKNFFIESDEILYEIIVGLTKGNIILQGPPGTGKTTLAGIICDLFNVNYNIITAVNDWTTYDTIGGYQPSINEDGDEIIIGKNGRIVESVLQCCNTVLKERYYDGSKQAHWLIIDELNRTDIDRVFGDLFTTLGTDDLEKRKLDLWFQKDYDKKELYVPKRYRIIGVMNNIDKNFVYDLSQGLSRRFTFINVNPPKKSAFTDEIKNVKEIAKNKVINKFRGAENILVNSESIELIYNNDVFKSKEEGLLEFLEATRYEGENYLGLNLGTAQIIDVYESVLIFLVFADVSSMLTETERLNIIINKSIDLALKSKIVPQMDGQNYDRLQTFYSYIKEEFKNFEDTLEAIRVII